MRQTPPESNPRQLRKKPDLKKARYFVRSAPTTVKPLIPRNFRCRPLPDGRRPAAAAGPLSTAFLAEVAGPSRRAAFVATMRVPAAAGDRRFEALGREVISTSRPVCSTNSMAARIFGPMLPSGKCPSRSRARASATSSLPDRPLAPLAVSSSRRGGRR